MRRSEPEPAAEDLYTNHVAWREKRVEEVPNMMLYWEKLWKFDEMVGDFGGNLMKC